MHSDIHFEIKQQLGIITLSRPQALHALTLSMVQELKSVLLTWEADERIKAIVIQALPTKAFCAGGDIRGLYEMGKDYPERALIFFHEEYELNYAISECSKPYISLMDGLTMGGGVGISLHGTFPIAGSRFVFAMPETAIGFFPDIGASYILSRLPDNIGLYLALTGNRLNAEEAKSLNLVKFFLKPQSFTSVLVRLLETDLSSHAHERVSEQLNQLQGSTKWVPFENQAMIASFFNEKSLEGVFAKLKASDDPWAREILNNLKQKSPLSLGVTFEQIQRAKSMSLKDCLAMDYCLVQHFIKGQDFYEGVRAAIIDKDKDPKWQPDSLDKLTDTMVAEYFSM